MAFVLHATLLYARRPLLYARQPLLYARQPLLYARQKSIFWTLNKGEKITPK